ncbi:hypothetical protein [Corynebacterium auriscanis]|uniref:hypothetical protein n=1 Tax=Corynebacterium auriscanis TaxID=99807 RepID=UPI003CEEFA1D
MITHPDEYEKRQVNELDDDNDVGEGGSVERIRQALNRTVNPQRRKRGWKARF